MTILKKREGFQQAFSGLDIDRVARDGVRDRARLLSDSAIIRNRLKVDAAIENARRLQTLRPSHGSFCGWLAAHHPLSKQDRVKLYKQTFVFMGGEIVGESLMSVGYLPDAHREDCPIMGRTRKLGAPCRSKKL